MSRDQKAHVLVMVSRCLALSSPFILLSGDVNATRQGAGSRCECSGETAGQKLRALGGEFPYVGETRMDKGKQAFPQGSKSKVKIPGRGSGKEPGSKARPQKVRITVTGSQQ